MKSTTIQALNQLNQTFYQQVASSFSQTRQSSWSGWKRVIQNFTQTMKEKQLQPVGASLTTVVDVASGNSRFYQFLITQLPKVKFDYSAVDANRQLLEIAKTNLRQQLNHQQIRETGLSSSSATFKQLDLTNLLMDKKPIDLPQADLIVVFGLMHHLPSFNLRQRLLNELACKLQPGGLLAVTFWKFLEFPRLRKKIINADKIAQSELAINLNDLEENDYFLGWQQNKTAYRYCHYSNDREIEKVIKLTPLKLIDRYRADGRERVANQYLIFKK